MTLFSGLQEEVLVGGKRFAVNKWSVIQATKNLPQIGKALAVPLSFILGAGESGLQEAIPQAFFMLFEQLEEQDITRLFQTVLSEVYVDGRKVDLNTDLENIDELLQLAAKALEMNYGCLMKGEGFKNLFGIMVPLHNMTQK